MITLPSGNALVLGNQVVSSKRFNNIKEAEDYLKHYDFELIVTAVGTALENMYNLKKIKK